jgi:hypothetical protein
MSCRYLKWLILLTIIVATKTFVKVVDEMPIHHFVSRVEV